MSNSETTEDIEHYEAPIVSLLGRDPCSMSNEELTAHIAQLRTIRTNPSAAKAAAAPKKKATPSISSDFLKDLLS